MTFCCHSSDQQRVEFLLNNRWVGSSSLVSAQSLTRIQLKDKPIQEYGDRLTQATTLSNQALLYQQQGQWSEANHFIQQSLSILNQQHISPEQQRVYAATLDILGQIQNTQGQPNQALEAWKQAESIYQTLNLSEQITNNRVNQAIAMQQLGLYPRACQTLLQSLGLDNQSCPPNEEVLSPQLAQSDYAITTRALSQLGNVLLSMGHITQSQKVLSVAAQQVQLTGQADALADLYLGLGNTARAQGIRLAELPTQSSFTESSSETSCLSQPPVTAMEAFQQSAVCYQKAAQTGDAETQVRAQLNLASLMSEAAHLLPSSSPLGIEVSLDTIEDQLQQWPSNHDTVTTRLKWVQTSLCLASQASIQSVPVLSPVLQQCQPTGLGIGLQADSSQDIYSSVASVPLEDIEQQASIALQQAQEMGDEKAMANALGYLGTIALQHNDIQRAKHYTEQALQQASAYQAPETNYLWLWQLGRIERNAGSLQEAIAAYRSAHQILKNLRSDLAAASPDVQFAFRDRVEPVYRELVDLLLPDESPSQANLAQARDVIESLQLAELHNFYQQACLDAQPQAIESIDKRAAVIYAIALQDRLAVITSLSDQPLKYHNISLVDATPSLGNTDHPIDQTVAQLISAISLPTRDRLAANQRIYDWLIRPSISDFESNQIKTLVFVLDGTLREVPVAALHNGHNYLIEDYNVALTPGLQLLSPQSLSSQKPRALAAGLTESVEGRPQLPEVARELQNISKVLPTEILLNNRFTSDRLEQSIQDVPYNVVHLATHAQFSSKADQTFLLAWDKRINVNDLDAVLRERERRLAKRPIELLILSACQTAAGDNRAALGLAGVAMRSGARSTIASLWSIPDQSTAELMQYFYTALHQPGTSKADALRQAQVKMLRSPQYSEPRFWSAFVLVGNWL